MSLKVAATTLPRCNAVPSAMLGLRSAALRSAMLRSLSPSPLRCSPLRHAPLSLPCPLRARRRRAQPTPHTVRHRRHRARLRSRLDYSRTPIIPPDYIKSMGSLLIRCSLLSRLCLYTLHTIININNCMSYM